MEPKFRIPLSRNSKAPLAGGSWLDDITDDDDQVSQWLWDMLNIGCPLKENGLVVVDFDTGKEPARDFYRQHKELCSVVVVTRRGAHMYFTGETKTRKFEHGDIKGNGYVVYPPSEVDGFKYWFAKEDWHKLQPFWA